MILLASVATLPVAAGASERMDSANEASAPAQPSAQTGTTREPSRDLEKSYTWDRAGSDRLDDRQVQDEPTGSRQALTWMAQLLLLLVPIALGLALAITSLRKDLRSRRRIPYRQRGPHSVGERIDHA